MNRRLKTVVVREFTRMCHCYIHFDSASHNITTFKNNSQLLLLANIPDNLQFHVSYCFFQPEMLTLRLMRGDFRIVMDTHY